MFSSIVNNPSRARIAGTWLLGSALINFGIAYAMWGERGVRNRVCGRVMRMQQHDVILQAYIAEALLRKGEGAR